MSLKPFTALFRIKAKISFKIILEFAFRPFSLFRRCRATKSTQVCYFFSCGHQHPPSQRLGVNQSNVGAIINSTSQIKIPPCTFLIDRAQQQKHVKVQVKDLKIATSFLQMLEKSTSAFNLTTKWKTYLTLGPKFHALSHFTVNISNRSTRSATAIFEKGEECFFLVHIE